MNTFKLFLIIKCMFLGTCNNHGTDNPTTDASDQDQQVPAHTGTSAPPTEKKVVSHM